MDKHGKTPRGRIIWKQWRGRVPIPPWLLYLFGIPLTFVGLFCLALGFGILSIPLPVPRLFITMFGLYFLFGGLVVFHFAS
ncbi:MAG: hypothetical protein SVX38_13820, partial [Chloroflexota bacterium]|nr:hypothetical protein [Chloroflexota bacterium]